jgi:hypothetical protein
MEKHAPSRDQESSSLSDPRSLNREVQDWLLRFCEPRRIPLAAVGVAAAVLYFLLFTSFNFLTGGVLVLFQTLNDASEGRSLVEVFWRSEAVDAALIGYVAVAPYYLRRGALQGLQALRPSLRCSDEVFLGLMRRVGKLQTRYLIPSIAIGVGAGLILTRFDPSIWPGGVRPPMSHPAFVWNVFQNSLLAGLIIRFVATEAAASVVHHRVGRNLVKVDLLNLSVLAPFGRKGQRSVILWIILSSIFSLFWLGPTAGHSNLPSFLSFLSAAGMSFFLAVYGVHRAIHTLRRSTLDRLNEQIRHAVSGRSVATLEDASLGNLIAYRGLIDGVSEWPFSLSTLLRTGLVVAVGVGSWLGGALMERFVNIMLQ